MKLLGKLFKILFLLLLALVLFGLGYYYAVTRKESLQAQKLLFNEKSLTILDNQGEKVTASSLFFKQTTPYTQIPQHTVYAFVDTEDKNFFSHNGFDYKRMVKAAINNVGSHSFKEGASTISQQLIKNTHLTQEKTFKRKFKEWKLTRQLEKRYSKEEILERYLNTIYFGHSCFGLTAASEFYFGKTPDQLTIGESAVLAGLVKSPNYYSPFKNPEKCEQRKKIVLKLMQKNGHLSEEEKKRALLEELPTPPLQTEHNAGYLHFVFDELSALSEKYSFKIGGNIQIRTALDQKLQAETEKIASSYSDCDKAVFILDQEQAAFKACVSSVGKIKRLPGSLLKPLLVYAPAIEENILSPATLILDEKVDYNGYAPENYDGNFHGYVSAREALEKSLNIPAVKTLESLGVKKASVYLEKLGLPVAKEDESLALALGGMKEGFALQDILSAYASFANGGKYRECGFITEISINGKRVYKRTTENTPVFSQATSYLINDMLKGTAKNGTAKKLRSLPFPIAAKTGTVGTEKGNTDAYALSYTQKDCIGVWLGNADNKKIEHTGGGAPCNLLFSLNEYLYEEYQKQNISIPDFQACKDVLCVALDKTAYYDTHTLSLADDAAPSEYTFKELFKKQCIPTKKSDIFSNPSIFTPTLHLEKEGVKILFDKHSPNFYEYKIIRYDYATHNTVYQGGFIESFLDRDIQSNKKYLYTVIPSFNGKEGKPIPLPAVSTKIEEHDSILDKEWWNY